jgi:GNAT superfamily N-acetyltransferase
VPPTLANLVLRDARHSDHTAAVDILVGAFREGAVTRWAEPDPLSRAAQLLPYFAALLQHAAQHGIVRLAEADSLPVGVAVWYPYPPAGAAVDVHDLMPNDSDAPGCDGARRLARLEQALAERHRTGVAPQHHYLAYLGVTPSGQNRGVGTALLRDHHTHLDRTDTPAYLEANDPRNRALYQRLGYTDHGAPVTVGGCPPVHPMWRTPNPNDQR